MNSFVLVNYGIVSGKSISLVNQFLIISKLIHADVIENDGQCGI